MKVDCKERREGEGLREQGALLIHSMGRQEK